MLAALFRRSLLVFALHPALRIRGTFQVASTLSAGLQIGPAFACPLLVAPLALILPEGPSFLLSLQSCVRCAH